MNNKADIARAALQLPRKSRAALAEKLLASLEDERELLEAAQEAHRRMQTYKRGEITGKPIDKVLRSLRKPS